MWGGGVGAGASGFYTVIRGFLSSHVTEQTTSENTATWTRSGEQRKDLQPDTVTDQQLSVINTFTNTAENHYSSALSTKHNHR